MSRPVTADDPLVNNQCVQCGHSPGSDHATGCPVVIDELQGNLSRERPAGAASVRELLIDEAAQSAVSTLSAQIDQEDAEIAAGFPKELVDWTKKKPLDEDGRFEVPTDWTFKRSDVAAGFDQHVREQLPWYEIATGFTAHVARHFINEGGLVYDIGCSTGNIGNALEEVLAARNAEYHGIESSHEMAKKFAGPGSATLSVSDACEFKYDSFDVAICFLVLMFIPIENRGKLLHDLISKCKTGGAIIVVDKFESVGGYFGTILSRMALAGKVATGVPAEQIVQKELSLSGVQRPMDREKGLPHEWHQFFKFGEFEGHVFLK